jgi:hypothetical protein
VHDSERAGNRERINEQPQAARTPRVRRPSPLVLCRRAAYAVRIGRSWSLLKPQKGMATRSISELSLAGRLTSMPFPGRVSRSAVYGVYSSALATGSLPHPLGLQFTSLAPPALRT